MANCTKCQGLMLAAVDASRVYHDLAGDLESAHIRHDNEQPFRLQQQIANALKNRDGAIQALSDHERTHAKRAVG